MSSQYVDLVCSCERDSIPNSGPVKNSSWFKIGAGILIGAIIRLPSSGYWA